MASPVIAFYRNTAELIIGILVKKTETHYHVQNPVLLGVSAEGPNISMNFIPHEMINIEKTPVPLRQLLKKHVDIFQYEISSLLAPELELIDNVVENYLKFSNAQVKQSNPEENIIKLF